MTFYILFMSKLVQAYYFSENKEKAIHLLNERRIAFKIKSIVLNCKVYAK